MKVAILVAIPKADLFNNCTLTLDSIRVGFPNVEVEVYNALLLGNRVKAKCARVGVRFRDEQPLTHVWNHAEWIRHMIETTKGSLCIVDPDVIFWKDVEWFDFSQHLAGYFCPFMWSDMVHSLCVPRLHTSFLWIRDCQEVLEQVQAKYKDCHQPDTGPFCPCDPYSPAVKFFNGEPLFWDTCANLFHMLGGATFQHEHLECYDHIWSSSFSHVIRKHIPNPEVFDKVYELAVMDPGKLRGFHHMITSYYNLMHDRAMKMANLCHTSS